MQSFKRNLLQHHLAIGHWMRTRRATGGLDPVSLQLEIELRGKRVRFFPQFIVEGAQPGQIAFTAQLQSGVSGFVSWLPYVNKRWAEASDKLAFKRFAAENGLRTPRWGQTETRPDVSYLVKASRSSLGQGLRGPYRRDRLPALGEGEFWEAFIPGRVIKAWFWDGQLAVAEVTPMPVLVGDGSSTVAQLAASALGPHAPTELSLDLLELQGVSLNSTPAKSQSVRAEFRYMSSLNPAINADLDVREKLRGSSLEKLLREAGQRCWLAIPEGLRKDTAFTVDAVLTDTDELELLEINCNPLLHPAFYASMLDSTFGISPPA